MFVPGNRKEKPVIATRLVIVFEFSIRIGVAIRTQLRLPLGIWWAVLDMLPSKGQCHSGAASMGPLKESGLMLA